METEVDKIPVAKKWKKGLLKAKIDRDKGKMNESGQKFSQKLVLTTQDYSDLIKWKAERKAKQSNSSRMFFYIGLATSLMLVITAFEWKFHDSGIVTELEMENANFEEFQDIPLTEQPPPPPPEKIIQQPKIVEVPDEEILEEIDVKMDVEMTEETVVAEIEFVEEEPEEEVAEEIFLIVEDKPEPIGGMTSFYKYVADNIKYPNSAARNNVQGRVFVQFVVNSQGQISDVVAVKGIGSGCDEEAVRIIENAPDWNPGKQRGRAVSVRLIMPITFMLAN